MIIDFHTHIFPKQMRDTRENYFPGEAEFKLLYDSPRSKLAGADDIINAMDKNGVDISVVFGFPWRHPQHFKRHNDYIFEAVARYPSRLVGFCCMDPLSADAVSEADRCLSGGLAGIGELAFYQAGFDDNALAHLKPLMALCRENDAPILIHTNEPVGHAYPGKAPVTLSQIYDLIQAFPDNQMVLAHWGGGVFFYHLMKKEVKTSMANVYFDTAASPFLYDPDVYDIANRILGSEKILFGSDYPLLQPDRYFAAMASLDLPLSDQQDICGKNAARILKLNQGSGSSGRARPS